jgi:hypothetical protein
VVAAEGEDSAGTGEPQRMPGSLSRKPMTACSRLLQPPESMNMPWLRKWPLRMRTALVSK